MTNPSHDASSRLAFLDWTRGVAALIMLQGHVFHSFTLKELRSDGAYVISQFIGGITPAVFLFLTGVTLAFLMESRERKGLPGRARVFAALRRSAYLFALAYLFRLQMWLFGWPSSPWTDLLRVDILNCMGLSVAVLSLMALFSTTERIRLCATLGLAIAAASPLVSALDWSQTPGWIKSYLAPDYRAFSFFPWGAFVAFGVSAGSILRTVSRTDMHRVMQWSALLGFGLVLSGQYFSNIPYSLYSNSEFWLNSPGLIVIKVGVILLMLAFAFLWNQQASAQGWSFVRQLGTTSLLVYWVHIELVYGRWLASWKYALTVGQTVAASVGVVLLMIGLSTLQVKWRQRPSGMKAADWLRTLAARRPVAVTQRVSGD
ncbi:MAG: heparan-alpha-glucosaminide N-acetyltransferase domain-containing protein [Bryobacteraceae bacterium]